MTNYDCIVINGDSYSAPSRTKVYGDFLSEQLGIPVKNFAIPGSNNQRIVRSSIEYLQEIKTTYKNPLVIVGWSFIRRLEVWYYGSNKSLLNQIPDSPDSRFITLDRIINAGEATIEQKALLNEDLFVHKQLMDFYTNMYMFAHALAAQNISYLFFSAARNTDCPVHCFSYIHLLAQVQWVTNNKNIYKLHEFCVMDWAKQNDAESHPVTGHLSQTGHSKFAQFMLDQLLD